MHREAYAYVEAAVAEHGPFDRVVEFGSFQINGSVAPLFGGAEYLGIDIQPGPGVDLVADCAHWEPEVSVDCIVCCEVFEHAANWPLMCSAAYRALRPGGMFLVTAAGPGRLPHSAADGGEVRVDEHYANVDPRRLEIVLDLCEFNHIEVDVLGTDVRAVAFA